jgi:hypothetical protein
MNTDTMKYWNVEKAAWVETVKEATDLGHGAKVPAKPKGSIRVRVPANS